MDTVREINRRGELLEREEDPPPAAERVRPARFTAVETVSVHPAARVVDHGGRILRHVDVAPVYVGSYWKTAGGTSDRAHNDAAMANLVKNKGQTGIWKQYGAGTGTTHRSVTLPQTNPRVMTQAQLATLVKQQVLAGKFDASNRERVFLIVLPPGCELRTSTGESSREGLGGFHASVTVNGHEVYYAAMAYPQRTAFARNGIDFAGNALDDLSIAESHEVTEAVTDPDVDLAMRTGDRSRLGWYDDVTRWSAPGSYQTHLGKGEIGDIPVLDAQLAGDTSLRTAWGHSEGFAFQKEWSQVDGISELAPRR